MNLYLKYNQYRELMSFTWTNFHVSKSRIRFKGIRNIVLPIQDQVSNTIYIDLFREHPKRYIQFIRLNGYRLTLNTTLATAFYHSEGDMDLTGRWVWCILSLANDIMIRPRRQLRPSRASPSYLYNIQVNWSFEFVLKHIWAF